MCRTTCLRRTSGTGYWGYVGEFISLLLGRIISRRETALVYRKGLTSMLNYAINNKASERANSLTLLTKNSTFIGGQVMAKTNLAQQPPKRKPEYNSWSGAIQRCTNHKHPKYSFYGGRGIKICDRWRNSFAAFYEDMGNKPSPKHSIDRIDNSGNYEPGNCRWTTQQQQCSNRRGNQLITYNGITDTHSGWSRRLGWKPSTVKHRIYRGMTDKEAIETPLRTDRRLFVVKDAITGEKIGEWDSHPECAKDLGLGAGNVSAVLRRKHHTAGGYKMEYIGPIESRLSPGYTTRHETRNSLGF